MGRKARPPRDGKIPTRARRPPGARGRLDKSRFSERLKRGRRWGYSLQNRRCPAQSGRQSEGQPLPGHRALPLCQMGSGVCCARRAGRRHSRTVLSALAERAERPFGVTASPTTPSVWPAKRCVSLPDSTPHTRTVLSKLPDRTLWPSGEKATTRTGPVWPLSTRNSFPFATSQTRIVWSWLPETARRPSGEKASASIREVLFWNAQTLCPPSRPTTGRCHRECRKGHVG